MAPFEVVTRSRLAKLYKKPWEDWDARYYVVDVPTGSILWAGSSAEWARVTVAHLESGVDGAEKTSHRNAVRKRRQSERRKAKRLRARARALAYDRRRAFLMARLIIQLRFMSPAIQREFIKRSIELGSVGAMQMWDDLRRQSMDDTSRISFKRIYAIVVKLYRATR